MSSSEIESMSTAPISLEINAIYTVLFNRRNEENWHWSICVATASSKATCVHAVQPIPEDLSQWALEIKEINLVDSKAACIAVRIGLQDSDSYGLMPTVEEVLKPIPMSIPSIDKGVEPKFTCRVWWREAVRKLHDSSLVFCPDVNQLEKDCKALAQQNNRIQSNTTHLVVHTSRK